MRKDEVTAVPSASLKKGDIVLVKAGEQIPGDGDVIDGAASVDESAITGESAPVIRESGGDRSAVTGGTTVLSDWIIVRITSEAGSSFLDKMIAMLEMAQLLERSSDWEDIYRITGRQLVNLLNRRLVVYKADGDILDEPEVYAPEGMVSSRIKAAGVLKPSNWACRTLSFMSKFCVTRKFE